MQVKGKSSKKNTIKYNINAVDLFCGAGGLTKGLENSGINVKLGIDIDPAYQYPYKANNKAKFLLESVEDVKADKLISHYGESDMKLLAGCAPCQTFSTYNQKANDSDKRWWLLLQFERLIREVSPDLVTMENVPGLISQDVFASLLKSIKEKGYHVFYNVINCAEYGLP